MNKDDLIITGSISKLNDSKTLKYKLVVIIHSEEIHIMNKEMMNDEMLYQNLLMNILFLYVLLVDHL